MRNRKAMKGEIINIDTKEVVYVGRSVRECKEWGRQNGFRSPQYYVRAKKKRPKYSNEGDNYCVDQSDISNF